MSNLNVNNNNINLLFPLGIFEEDGSKDVFIDEKSATVSLPAPVIISAVEPPAAKEDTEMPHTTQHSNGKNSSSEKEVSVVRTRVGLFEQLSNINAEGLKTGKAAPLTQRDETKAADKQETSPESTEAVTAHSPADAHCNEPGCQDFEDAQDPWASESRVSAENWGDTCELKYVRSTKCESKEECDGNDDNNNNNNNRGVDEDIRVVSNFASFNSNNNNIDPQARFKDILADSNGFQAYQPSAIAAQAERRPAFERYIPAKSQCRIGDGAPGAPASTEGNRFKPVSASKAGVPWGARKQRVLPKEKYINQQPYQTLNPSGKWTHGTQQQQPANKQAQVDRQNPFPRYIAKSQQCKARPEFRKKTMDQGVASSCKKPIKRKRREAINLDKVRCNCPGLYPKYPSLGSGNYWDEEDDDEAILAEMCPGDDLQECGQGVGNVFPLEEWADEWEDGVLSGDCINGKLAPGTLELLPWENPCREELLRRKARVQELRNKRWAALDKAKAEAERLKEEAGFGGRKKAEIAGKELERIALNEYGQKSWSLLSWFSPSNWASAPGSPSFCGGSGSSCADTNRDGKTCTTRTSTGPNQCSNNSSTDANPDETAVETGISVLEEEVDYEWDQADESDEDYNSRMTATKTKAKIEEAKKRIQRMELLKVEREKSVTKVKVKKSDASKDSRGVLSSVFGMIGCGSNASHNNDLNAGNQNNNAANRCFKPCPPCPQQSCAPVPFECPCNDVHCPKKLKANKDVVQKKKDCKGMGGAIGNVDICIDVTDDLEIEGIDISVKKPPPDLSLGCPCGDAECKKKKCDPPKPKKFATCDQRNGKMALQEACAVQECERDICAKDDEPSECPCTDEACRKKRGGQEGFVFLYPPTDKIKLDDKGCPLQQQMRCVVTQIGDRPPKVSVQPVGKPLECALVPPCPCPDYWALEEAAGSGSGNAWGEEIDDETSPNCNAPPPKKEAVKDCGSTAVEGAGGATADDFEWDFWDSPCGEVKKEPAVLPEDVKKCQEFMEKRKGDNDNSAAAIEAALEAFEYEKVRKERAKIEAEARKRRVAELREAGLTEDEIVHELCVNRVPGPCELMGEFPPQASCAPNPPPPGCPCPDPACPKRAPFDYQMHDTDLAKIKNPYDRKNTEKFLSSQSYKTMECELKNPTYKDLSKSYPKRPKNTKCPCPECVTDVQKAWAEVEKMKIGPPPECPCKDPKCPKKPVKEEVEEVVIKEDLGPCAMKTHYPKQSGCIEVLRCDLIRDVCSLEKGCDADNSKPEARYKCHACSLRNPMPKQSACPDYDCRNCKLVCHKCGCKPTKCDKCENEELSRKPEEEPHEPCPPCTVMGPLPKQSGCKEIHPCNEEHPCMCDPNTGEPIEALGCGPCDTKYHDHFPEQGDCAKPNKALVEGCRKKGGPRLSLFDQANNNGEIEDKIDSAALTNAEPEETVQDGLDHTVLPPNMSIIDSRKNENSQTNNNREAKDKGNFATIEPEETTIKQTITKEETIEETDSKEVTLEETETKEETLKQTVTKEEAVKETETKEEAIKETETKEETTIKQIDEKTVQIPDEDVTVEADGESGAGVDQKTVTESAIEVNEDLLEDAGRLEQSFVDLKKGMKANVMVEFQVVGMHDLSEDDYKKVDEVFGARKEEVSASKAMIEEELKREALNAVREKMRQSSPVAKKEPSTDQQKHQPEVRKFESIEDIGLDEQCDRSCSFWGMGISAYVPAIFRPKAKCHPKPDIFRNCSDDDKIKRSEIQLKRPLSLNGPTKAVGLNAILELEASGDRMPTSAVSLAKKVNHQGTTGVSPNWLAKKQELVWVNNDDGIISILNLDRLSKENQESIDRTLNISTLNRCGPKKTSGL